MTATGDFLPPDEGQDLEGLEGSSYPVAFGVEFTPKIQAIAIALLGIAGAFAIFQFLVRPVREQITTLEAEVTEKAALVQRQEASLQDVAALEAELDEVVNQRVEIFSLLGDARSLETLLLDINQQIENSNAAIADVIRADFETLVGRDLAAIGLSTDQIERIRERFADDPGLQQRIYASALFGFNPGPLTNYGVAPPELQGKINSYTVDVGMRALFPQTISILRNLERLEPLIIVRDLRQTQAPPTDGTSEEDLEGITRPLSTNFTLEVLVPSIDPAQPPPPPATEEEEGAEEGG